MANKKDALRMHASTAVAKALSNGTLIKPTVCSRCGTVGKRIEGHHKDYSQPLNIEWLCSKCHRVRHIEAVFSIARARGIVRLRVNQKSGILYIPSMLRDKGFVGTLSAYPNEFTIVFVRPNTSVRLAIKGIDHIRKAVEMANRTK